MIDKFCLIIDNEDQSGQIEKLIREASHEEINLNCFQFPVGSTSFTEILNEGVIDLQKVCVEYKKNYKGIEFDYIAIDWDLDDPNGTTGIELLRQFNANKIAQFTPVIIYSGLLDEVIKDTIKPHLQIIKSNDGDRPVIKSSGIRKIKSLVKNGVIEYLDREDRDTILLKRLKEDIQSTDLILVQLFESFPDLKFENAFVNKSFNGMSYGEIAKELKKKNGYANEFKKELIGQTIAYLTEKI